MKGDNYYVRLDFPVWIQILETIYTDNDKNHYKHSICKKLRITYSHTVKVVNTLVDCGLAKGENQGRIKSIKLTKEGEKVGLYAQKLMHISFKKGFDPYRKVKKKNGNNIQI